MSRTATPRPPCRRPASQRGAATLIVVMVLFFLAALAAAYASRNLIFEQRTSANQYRSTQAFEAADAGIEWAVAMLNSGRIDDACEASADLSDNNFRERYLVTDNATGNVTRRPHSDGASRLWAACSLNGGTWQCACPTGNLPTTGMPVGQPAFAVRFVNLTTRPGMVRIEVNGCNSYDTACLTAVAPVGSALCASTLCSLLSLHSAAKSPPAAAVTARGDVSGNGTGTVYNTDSAAGGITVHSGGTIGSVILVSAPGTPSSASRRDMDTALSTLPIDTHDCLYCTFAVTFGLQPDTYRTQPAALEVDCGPDACDAGDVNTALSSGRGRVVWLKGVGGLTLDDPADQIGAATDPVVLVIDGPLNIDASATVAAQLHGLVYAASASLNGGEIRGALVSASTVTAGGVARVVYDADLLSRLRLASGSFVRVPGSWRDFP